MCTTILKMKSSKSGRIHTAQFYNLLQNNNNQDSVLLAQRQRYICQWNKIEVKKIMRLRSTVF